MKKMRFNVIFILCIFFAISCEKENEGPVNFPDYILSGDTTNSKHVKLNYTLENYTTSDTIPSNNIYGQSNSETNPMNIDEDTIFDIRLGCSNLIERDFLVGKAFFIGNNYGNIKNIEFAVQHEEFYGVSADTTNPVIIKLISTFNKLDTINENQKWVQDQDVQEFYFLSYYYKFQKYFDHYSGTDLFYNGNVLNKYIAIRKKVNEKYIYGWIEFSITNYDKLEITGSAFAYGFTK